MHYTCPLAECGEVFEGQAVQDDVRQHIREHGRLKIIKNNLLSPPNSNSLLTVNGVLTCNIPGCGLTFDKSYYLLVHKSSHKEEQALTYEDIVTASTYRPRKCPSSQIFNRGSTAFQNILNYAKQFPQNTLSDVKKQESGEQSENKSFLDRNSENDQPIMIDDNSSVVIKILDKNERLKDKTNVENRPTDTTVPPERKKLRPRNKNMEETNVTVTPEDPKKKANKTNKQSKTKKKVDNKTKNTSNKHTLDSHTSASNSYAFRSRYKTDISKHDGTHTGEMPFVCTYKGCDYATTHKKNLNRHYMIHTGEKPFACTYEGCDYATRHKENFNSHYMIHTGEKPFACTYEGCDYATTHKKNLNRHYMIHTGEKPFACTYEGCDYATRHKENFNSHYMIHTGEKPFACTYEGCDFATTHKKNLNTHYMIHTGEKPFACTYEGCDYATSRKETLNLHYKKHAC